MAMTSAFDHARAARVIPDGQFGRLGFPPELTPVIVRGQGSHIWDVTGREYIDLVMGSGPMLIGHAHPLVVERVTAQVARGSQFYTLNPPAIELIEEVTRAVPGVEAAKFASTGSEAVSHAIRLARAFTGRDKILKFEGGYHGHYDYAQVSQVPSRVAEYPRGVLESSGVPGATLDTVLVAPFNDAAATERLVEQHARDLAAVIMEPVQRFIAPQPGFLERVREVTRTHDVLLIFDEIVTGFRLAYGGAQEYWNVRADLTLLGKAVGGGYPIGLVGGRRDVMALAGDGSHPRSVAYSGTANGNPISATAGLATLEVLRAPGTYPRLHEIGEYARRGLDRLFAKRGVEAHAAGIGPLFQVLFCKGPVHDYAGYLRHDRKRAKALQLRVLERGVLVNPTSKSYLSLAHTSDDLDRVLRAYDESLATI